MDHPFSVSPTRPPSERDGSDRLCHRVGRRPGGRRSPCVETIGALEDPGDWQRRDPI